MLNWLDLFGEWGNGRGGGYIVWGENIDKKTKGGKKENERKIRRENVFYIRNE